MPEFGYGVGDVVIFLIPFLLLYFLKRFANLHFSVAAGGIIVVGIMCCFAQRVNLRYGVVFEGRSILLVAGLYIALGISSIAILQWRRNKPVSVCVQGDVSEEKSPENDAESGVDTSLDEHER